MSHRLEVALNSTSLEEGFDVGTAIETALPPECTSLIFPVMLIPPLLESKKMSLHYHHHLNHYDIDLYKGFLLMSLYYIGLVDMLKHLYFQQYLRKQNFEE